jgi:hypothetical protein
MQNATHKLDELVRAENGEALEPQQLPPFILKRPVECITGNLNRRKSR